MGWATDTHTYSPYTYTTRSTQWIKISRCRSVNTVIFETFWELCTYVRCFLNENNRSNFCVNNTSTRMDFKIKLLSLGSCPYVFHWKNLEHSERRSLEFLKKTLIILAAKFGNNLIKIINLFLDLAAWSSTEYCLRMRKKMDC
jgi:hypothetical protein